MEVDFTALEAVDAVRDELARDGTVFALARVKQDLLVRLEAFGLASTIGAENLFPTLPTAVGAYQQWAASHQRRPGQGPEGSRPSALATEGKAAMTLHDRIDAGWQAGVTTTGLIAVAGAAAPGDGRPESEW